MKRGERKETKKQREKGKKRKKWIGNSIINVFTPSALLSFLGFFEGGRRGGGGEERGEGRGEMKR